MKPMKKSRKLVMAVAAACILTCTTAVAASGFFGMTGHNILGSETYSVQAAQEKTEKTLGFAPVIPESFAGEFKFASSYESQWQGADEAGNPIGEFYDISQGVVEAIDKISNNVIRKYPDDNIEVGQGVFVLSKKELDTLMLNKKEKIEKAIINKILNDFKNQSLKKMPI